MKKFLNISLLSLVALSSLMLSSCKNEIDEIFDEDAIARLDNKKAEYIDILTDKGGKWQMEYYANADEPGYIYLMTFDKNGSVTISGENQWIGLLQGKNFGAIGYGSETSLWDVITDNGPVLSFNSFNKYFHLFADPEDIPSTDTEADDETGYGHEGDYEFDLMKYSNDTLYITGKKYGIDMIMTRVSPNVDDEVYMGEVIAMADSFFNAKIPQVYINLPNGVRWIVKDGATSILKVFREGADEISTSETYNVIITHDGLSFMNPVTLDGYTIKNFIRQPDGSLLCRDDNETTMTADPLSSIISNSRLTWRADLTNIGGVYAGFLPQIASELTAYNKSTLVYIQLAYVAAKSSFAVTFNVKKGATKINPTYYVTLEPQGDTQVKMTVGEGDQAGELYATKVPSMRAFADALAGTFNLSANSLLAPVNMKMEQGNNYIIWNIQ